MNKIYLLRLEEVNEEVIVDDNYSHKLFEEITDVVGVKYIKYIGFSNNDEMFVRLPEYILSELENVLSKYATFSKDDVSSSVINGDIQKIYPEVEVLTPYFFSSFREDVETIDDVLDKINRIGIKNLDTIDYFILSS